MIASAIIRAIRPAYGLAVSTMATIFKTLALLVLGNGFIGSLALIARWLVLSGVNVVGWTAFRRLQQQVAA